MAVDRSKGIWYHLDNATAVASGATLTNITLAGTTEIGKSVGPDGYTLMDSNVRIGSSGDDVGVHTFYADGTAEIGATFKAGTLRVWPGGSAEDPSIALSGSDGSISTTGQVTAASASFANGAATIGSDGAIVVASGGDASQFNSGLTAGFVAIQDLGKVLIKNSDSGAVKANAGGTLKVDTTTTGNVGGGEDDLISFTVPANTLANDGEFLEFDCWGTFAGNTNPKRLRGLFGSAPLIDSTALVLNGVDWRAHGKIVRVDDGDCVAVCTLSIGGTLLSSINTTIATSSFPGEDLTSAVIFKLTGQDSGGTPVNASITQYGMVLKWYPAQ